jgi:non-ribosomal peptide synthetase component F
VEVIPGPERRQVVEEWNATVAYPRDRYIHELFEKQVERTPEAVALVFGEVQLSYGELNARANRLAHHLCGLGVKPEGAWRFVWIAAWRWWWRCWPR